MDALRSWLKRIQTMFVPTVAVAANRDGVRSHREVRRTRRTFAELVGDH